MSRPVHFVLFPLVLCCALLLAAVPAAAIDVCGNGICATNAIPPENATNCPADCGGGPNDCPVDYCENGSCSRPAAGVDADFDAVPDQLEFDLAHKFFPSVLLQWHDEDRSESYLYRNRATPYVLQPYIGNGTLCDSSLECLELRFGITFFYDHGDTPADLSEHQGDNELYAVLLRKNPFWQGSSFDPAAWEMFRDFTSAHWGYGLSDSSRVAAYGHCPQPCGDLDSRPRDCNARPTCYAGGTCSGWGSCGGFTSESECLARACTWTPTCNRKFNWACDRDWPLDANTTLFCAESKHALYHSDDECDGGGFWNSDDCPNNQYDLRDWKIGKLQNVGNPSSHAAFDTKIQHPSHCGFYDVWGGHPFGEDDPYMQYLIAPLNWALY